jgi:NADP-reducing hydrogenase subunit HndD
MAKNIAVDIDGRRFRVPAGFTLLQAAAEAKQPIPTLCTRRAPCVGEPCGICVVELDGERDLSRACARVIDHALSFHAYTRRVRRERRRVLSALLHERQSRCISCSSLSTCDLIAIAREYDLPVPQEVAHTRNAGGSVRTRNW